MLDKSVGLLGATSLVGDCLLPLLIEDGWRVVAFTRKRDKPVAETIIWRQAYPSNTAPLLAVRGEKIPYWISLAPIRVLPSYLGRLEECGVKRLVALSSTSCFTKADSSDPREIEYARELVAGENSLLEWADNKGVELVVLRPTLIYGLGRDKNISEILRFIRRFRFFPLLGPAVGLRQPVFAGDVASACLAALTSAQVTNRTYNISGGETIRYRDMITRIFLTLGLQPLMLSVPLPLFRFAVACLRLLPRYKKWTVAMAERMNRDMVFDHCEATCDLHFSPREFRLGPGDLPRKNAIF